MYSITEHHNPPYIEAVVFDRYPTEYREGFETVIIRYAQRYEEFCYLEVQHGKISNGLWYLLQTGGKISEELLAAFKNLKRMAVVSDDPGLLMKILVSLPRLGSMEMRLFKLHELDDARAWMKV